MSDYDSSLPIRTENDGDISSKISDATIPSQQLKVNADGSIDVNASFSSTTIGITDGTNQLGVNSDGSINTITTLDTATLAALENISATVNGTVALDDPTLAALENINAVVTGAIALDASTISALQAVTATISNAVALDSATLAALENINAVVSGTVSLDPATLAALETITVTATDLDIRDLNASTDSVQAQLTDETGTPYSDTNPLSVFIEGSAGDKVVDYQTSTSVAKNTSTTHSYTVTAGKTFCGEEAWASGSGKLRVEVRVSGATIFVGFNSTANPNVRIPLDLAVSASAGSTVDIIITNRDNQSQDLYSTLTGVEKV